MRAETFDFLVNRVERAAQPLSGGDDDYDHLLDRVGEARFVLLGEASHGTHEFYRERARITRRLIEEKNFQAVAIEGDWPDAFQVNRFVRGLDGGSDANEALGGFRRFPAWMWRNRDVEEFVAWLAHHNRSQQGEVGFYGLDLYSLYSSMAAVLAYLERVDPVAAVRARARYACFEAFGEDSQRYGAETAFGATESCEEQVVSQLVELTRAASRYGGAEGAHAAEEYFAAEQNARLVRDAEQYYRAMFRGPVGSWNLRDRHMADTLDALVAHRDHLTGERTKVVVWAHNSHIGDARATQMGQAGELNIGQLIRERYEDNAVLVGFTTATGSVTAADEWGGPHRVKSVNPPLRSSVEHLFHRAGSERFLLDLSGDPDLADVLRTPLIERAIGVIYRPEAERASHYFWTRLADQFDAVIHLERTTAVLPLDPTEHWRPGEEVPEAFPSGL